MRTLLYILIVFGSSATIAQQETGNPPATNTPNKVSNSEMNLNLISTESLEEVEQLDSVVTIETIQQLSIEKKVVSRRAEETTRDQAPRAKGRIFSKKTSALPPAPPSPVMVEEKTATEKEPEQLKREVVDDVDKAILDAEKPMPVASEQGQLNGVSAAAYESTTKKFATINLDSDLQRSSRSPSQHQQFQMDQAVNYFEVNAPTSFEHHYFKYVAGNYNVDLFPHLEEAQRLRPENADVNVQMAGYYMINDTPDSAIVYLDKLIDADRLTNNVIEYTGDLLRSVPDDGVLITHGFDDSYGSYYVQNKEEVRNDVRIISLDFLQSEAYRSSLKNAGYRLPDSSTIDIDYLVSFCELNVDKNISISLTTPQEYFLPIQEKLFVVGLVFEYHEDAYNNFYKNDYLWNEELEKGVIEDPVDEKGKQLSANYLPMLLHLRKVYQQRGDTEKQKEVDEVSDKVGVQCRKYEQVQKVKASY